MFDRGPLLIVLLSLGIIQGCSKYSPRDTAVDGTEAPRSIYTKDAGVYQSALGDQVLKISADKTFVRRQKITITSSKSLMKTAQIAEPFNVDCEIEVSGRIVSTRQLGDHPSQKVKYMGLAVQSTNTPITNFMVFNGDKATINSATLSDPSSAGSPTQVNNEALANECAGVATHLQTSIMPFDALTKDYIYLSHSGSLQKQDLMINVNSRYLSLDATMLNRFLESIKLQGTLATPIPMTLTQSTFDNLTQGLNLNFASADGSDQVSVNGIVASAAYDVASEQLQVTFSKFQSQLVEGKQLKSSPFPTDGGSAVLTFSVSLNGVNKSVAANTLHQ